MSGYFRQIQHGDDAAHKLQQRLAREEMGDEAYEKHISHSDDRTFKIVGVVFIAAFGLVVLGMALLDY